MSDFPFPDFNHAQLVHDPETLDLLYATDGIGGPVSRPSTEEATLHRNADAVSVYLARGGQPDAEAALSRLAPYTQLAFLASLGARRAEVLDGLADPVAFVERLVADQPAGRAAVTTSLVQLIADNWCHVGSAFDGPAKDHAGLGAALLALVQDREDCPPEAYVHGAMYHEWTGDYAEGVAVVEHGLARYPRCLDLAWAGMALANVGGLTAEASTFTLLVDELENTPDERSIVDQSFALVQAGDVAGAREILLAYLHDDGEMTADVWNNLMFAVCRAGPPAEGWEAVVRHFLAELPDHETWIAHDGVLACASAALNENGYAAEAVEVLDWARDLMEELDGPLMANYTYSAYQTGDYDTMQRVAEVAEAALERSPEDYASAALFESLADLHVALDQPDRALDHLRRLREHGRDDFASLRTSEELEPLWDHPDFGALFDA